MQASCKLQERGTFPSEVLRALTHGRDRDSGH